MSKINESRVNLYIVDYDEMSLKILKNKFSSCSGYRVFTYKTSDEFLEEFNRFPFAKRHIHIVILDYVVNGIKNEGNGIDILRKIKAINSAVEIIILSGVEDVEIATSAMRSGAVAFIKKNENSYLRIQNQVKFVISQKSLDQSKKHSIMARVVFVLSIVVLAVFAIIVFFTDIL